VSILLDILKATEAEVARRRNERSLADLKQMVKDAPRGRNFHAALATGFCLIAEIKVKSPSGGQMDSGNVERAAKVYENAPGVAAVSVITQERYFGGSIRRLRQTRDSVSKPILRKDFIFDEYQVFEARAFGADAVLLMATLNHGTEWKKQLQELFDLTRFLGMDALVEIGMNGKSLSEMVSSVPIGTNIWGANARKFHGTPFKVRTKASRLLGRDFTTSSTRHVELRRAIPPGKLAVAESGIEKASQLSDLSSIGYNAVLIGTAFLKRQSIVEDVVQAFSDAALEIRRKQRTD